MTKKVKAERELTFRERYLPNTYKYDYNDWFQFFQKQPATFLLNNQQDFQDNLPADGYAAFCRWLDIFENPVQMEKIAKSKMENDQTSDLLDLAVGDDDEKFYVGIIRDLTSQIMDKNISPQEFARLSANLIKARDNLREIRSRKPKNGTVLAKVLEAAKITSAKPKKTVAKSSKKRNPRKVVKKKSTPVKTTSPEAAGASEKEKLNNLSSKKSTTKAKK